MGSLKRYFVPGLLPALIIANIITATAAFILAVNTHFPDAKGFWLMSEGINAGRFSSWYFLDTYYPETLRTPGYPLLLALIKLFNSSPLFIKIIQLASYFISLFLCFKIVNKLSGNNNKSSIVFLCLTAINIQIPYYSGYISSDIWCIFFTAAIIYVLVIKPKTIKNGLLLGILAGLNFIMRPAFLLFPFVITLWYLLFKRDQLKYISVHLIVFCITLLPFTYWNFKNHNSIQPTPIEGGAGVAHIGYWSFRLPKGYQENYYWGNVVPDDLTNPFTFSDEEFQKNKIEFENEWKEILDNIKPLNKKNDLKNLESMSEQKLGIFKLYNSEYTLARESLLKKKIKEHILEKPAFYIETRIYSFFRLYFTGINKNELERSATISSTLKSLFPFAVTFISICIGYFISVILLLKNKYERSYETGIIIILCFYQGAVHAFFTIQGRYLVPVHLLILILVALAITRNKKLKSGQVI